MLNGKRSPAPLQFAVGKTYRFRFVNILPVEPIQYSMVRYSVPVSWRSKAKDGASLPASLVREQTAVLATGVGETYDFEWTPREAPER